ncbi:tRNA methyltransferase 10 homolog B [Protopterus annectens]|uniref:tRNA methyltransferase 10 homolog B n=1 Tax=Protopterus annectens TaxID=7888 RepID=UPI001CF9EE7F|nr:tRNA methyltransferase 10 homolog B [Protopterus annectens]
MIGNTVIKEVMVTGEPYFAVEQAPCKQGKPKGNEDEVLLSGIFELLQIEVECESSGTQQHKESCYSKNVLRKKKHWENTVAAKKIKRKQKKQKKKENLSSQSGVWPLLTKRDLKVITKEKLLKARDSGPRICIDLSMTDHMNNKEISRLAAQIRRLYGTNRKSTNPFRIYLTSFIPGGPIHSECLRMNDGFTSYIMDMVEESYLDLFPQETIVYLTPDSDCVLEDIEPNKVYVFGGLVDESIQKKLTYTQAQENSVQTARLPIREYMVKKVNLKNYHSEILAVNQVFEVISTYYETRNWQAALQSGIPPGKGYVIRTSVAVSSSTASTSENKCMQ